MAGRLSVAVCPPQRAKLLRTRLRAILFSLFCTCVRPGDTRRASAEAAPRLLKILALQRLSFSIKQIPRLGRFPARRIPVRSLSAPLGYYFPKALNGAAGYQQLERGASDMGSNFCACTVFLQNEIYFSPQKTPVVHVDVEKRFLLGRVF